MRIVDGRTQSMDMGSVSPIAIATNLAGPPMAAVAPSFASVYDQQFDYVWHVLRRLGVPSRYLPDVAQDVFVTVYRRLDTFDPARPVRPWLFGICYRVAADHARLAHRRREIPQEASEDLADEAPSASDAIEQFERRALVSEALASIDLDRRAVLIAHDIDEQPMNELAEALSVPVKTLYSRLRVAREEFANAVRRIQLRRGER